MPDSDLPKGLRFEGGGLRKVITQADGTFVMGPPVHDVELAFTLMSHTKEALLKPDEQGLILSGSIGRDADGKPASLSPPTAQELRHHCLLWDRLDYPGHDQTEELTDPDMAFLKSEGILVRTQFSYMASAPMRARMEADADLLAGPAQAFSQAEQRQPGQWSLARPVDGGSFAAEDMAWGRGLLFELHNAIPVPAAEVPLADVLEFKAKRFAELRTLRSALGEVYQTVLAAPDAAFAYRQHLNRLDRALADAVKVSRESKFPIQFSSLQAKLDQKIWVAGSAAFAAASSVGLGLTNAALSALGVAALSSLNKTAGLRQSRSKGTPFEYVTRFHQDLRA
ncbi:DUF6236 family protein [Caulobacter sp. BP25]|uniref:DUF6236 family protein n=1 Tax=Caulobacter sp. BP25 TaxID=2048900 RepID=UPI000C12A5C6|nr:DUF6236 family protein [Caulobacter sp. BP25]PHY20939.1 hypothetical protein CSW59_06945 [Caulobacter sp. BP25]